MRGNSATALYRHLCVRHKEHWLGQSTMYLSVLRNFMTQDTDPTRLIAPLPQMVPVPCPSWLLSVYAKDELTRLPELKARVTSVYGSILKMDSTKKVTKKLAGDAAGTAAWVTDVGNEIGQVLMCVLTEGEGKGLLPMCSGLVDHYRQAGEAPPQVLYVDRDCCSAGTSASDLHFQLSFNPPEPIQQQAAAIQPPGLADTAGSSLPEPVRDEPPTQCQVQQKNTGQGKRRKFVRHAMYMCCRSEHELRDSMTAIYTQDPQTAQTLPGAKGPTPSSQKSTRANGGGSALSAGEGAGHVTKSVTASHRDALF